MVGGWQEVVELQEVHVFLKPFFSAWLNAAWQVLLHRWAKELRSYASREEDYSIIYLIISMSIFSQGSGDVGQSVLDPDWNTLAAMDFH